MEFTLLPILLPGLAGLIALLLPQRFAGIRTALGVLVTFATLVAGLAIIDVRTEFSWSWFELGPLQVDLAFRVDVFSAWATGFVALMGFLVSLYALGWYRPRGGAPGRFYAYLLLAVSGAAGVLLAANLLLLVLFWEIVTLMLFLLVASGRERGAAGAAKAFILLGIGDMALLLAVVLVALRYTGVQGVNPLFVGHLAEYPLAGGATDAVIFLLFFVAAGAKAGAMPFHSWIPTMSTETDPPVMALLPASIDKVLGIYLLTRLCVEWSGPGAGLRMVVMAVGVVTILGAVFMALVQRDLRRLLSFHAVSQVGYMLLGIGTGTVIGVMGGVFHMLNHAIYKSCLFLGAGSVERETGTMRLDRLGGLVKVMPWTFGCMLIASLAIAGVPPFNGFASKWLVYQACVVDGQGFFLVAALFGSVLTLASFVKVLHSVFWGPLSEKNRDAHDGGITMGIPLVTLASLCVLLGVLAFFPLDHWVGPVVGMESSAAVRGSAALSGEAEPAARFEAGSYRPMVITALLLFGTLIGFVIAFLGNMQSRRERGVFNGGEALDPVHNTFPGTEFYRTVRELPGLRWAMSAGERGSTDLYEIGGKVGGAFIGALRRLHSGLITDYLFWCFLGLVILLAALLWR